MNQQEIKILTEYNAIWFWWILGWISLMNSFVFLELKRYELFGGLVGVFVICALVSLKRKWRFENEN